MMNTIKEKIITISAKEKVKNIFLLMSSLVLSLILIGTYTENDKWIIVMIVTISLSFILMFQTLEIIGKCEKSVLKNNSLCVILLSKKEFLISIFLIVAEILTEMVNVLLDKVLYLINDLICSIIVILLLGVIVFLLVILPVKVTEFFEKKIK